MRNLTGVRKRKILQWFLYLMGINMTIYVILYGLLEHHGDHHLTRAAKWFYEFIHPLSTKEYVYSEEPCYEESDIHIVKISSSVQRKFYNNSHKCYTNERNLWEAEINMEKEFDIMRIFYPKYVYPVSGYLQLMMVDSWKVKRLKVIIMPHSHQDPGWTRTYLMSFVSHSRHTLNNIVNMLSMNNKTKFIWSEVVFLFDWWNQADKMKQDKLKRLIKKGQVEITTGGWVMTDEGTAHYTAMLNQLIEGHQWLQSNLDVQPRTGWSVDPFGHSPTMAYLLKQSGIDSMVIQRVHYNIKQHFASKQKLEFLWRQEWAQDTSSDILCHLLPFRSYAIQDSCGPDPYVCCQFDFFKERCYFGNKLVKKKTVDTSNIDTLAKQLWEQFQKKAELFQTNVVLVPHGDDFRYAHPTEWYTQMNNMESLMRYINARPHLQTEVKFGTLSDYFDEVVKSGTKFPTLSGDFFTYADRGDDYWSGYYSSRPHYKHIIRCLQDFLRSLEILFSYTIAMSMNKNKHYIKESLVTKVTELAKFRQQVALFQHHDAITGTSAHKVMEDYGKRLHESYKKSFRLFEESMSYIVRMHSDKENEVLQGDASNILDWTHHNRHMDNKLISLDSPKQLLLYNSLSFGRESVMKLYINKVSVKVIAMETGVVLNHQISPVFSKEKYIDSKYELTFLVSLPGLSVSKFLLTSVENDNSHLHLVHIQLIKTADENPRFGNFPVDEYSLPTFSISNEYLTATFFSCDGRLQYVTMDNSTRYKSEVKLMTYGTGSWSNPFQDKSGAYLFLPDGHAKVLREPVKYLYVLKGQVHSSVLVGYPSVIQIYTVYNVSGAEGMGVHVENIVDMTNGSIWNNKELMMRVVSDVKDKNNQFCVDLNGFQMHRKKTRKKLPIQGNFYPMTSMVFIETGHDRLTLLSSESHGVASLSPGWLEVVLDRRLIQDDWRGLSEGITDNVSTRSSFVLLFESRNNTGTKNKKLDCYPSPTADILSKQIESHVVTMTYLPVNTRDRSTVILSSASQNEITLVNLKFLALKDECMEVLFIVHSSQLDCECPVATQNWNFETSQVSFTFSEVFKTGVVTEVKQMALTGVRTIRTLKAEDGVTVKPMEIQTFKLTVCP